MYGKILPVETRKPFDGPSCKIPIPISNSNSNAPPRNFYETDFSIVGTRADLYETLFVGIGIGIQFQFPIVGIGKRRYKIGPRGATLRVRSELRLFQ